MQAYPHGTFWYHSHVGGQRSEGSYGALIVKKRMQDEYYKDFIMHVADYHHESIEEVCI